MKRFGLLFLVLSSVAYSTSITAPSTTPATSSVDNGIVRYSGTSGDTLKSQTIVTIDDFGNISGIHGVAYTWPGSQGAASTCLKNDGAGALTWGTCGGGGGGGVSEVDTGNGLTGGPITATGTIALAAVPHVDGFIANEGAYPNHGFLFNETSTDTGFTSPSDGEIDIYANGSIAAKVTPTGVSEIHGVPYTWPGTQGASNSVMLNNGSGGLSWGSVTGTANTVATFDNTGALVGSTLPVANGYIAQEGTYPTSGFLFSESGNDTGFTSPSDGVIYQYGNSVIGSKWESIGPTEIRGVPIFFPTVQGAASSVMTNDGSGNLSWNAIPSPTLPQNLTESFDPANASSTRYNIQTTLTPVADSSATNINELQVYTDNFSAFPVNGVTSINVGNQNLGSANVAYNHIFNAGQTVGNGTDPITVGEVRGSLVNAHVQAGSTANAVIGNEYSLGVDAGGAIGSFQGFKTTGNIDHATGGIEHDLAQKNITTADNFVHGFIAGDHVGTAKDNVVAFVDQTTIDDMPTRNTGYVSLNIGPSVTNSGTTVGGYTEISAHSNVAGHVINDLSFIEGGESVNAINRNLNYLNLHPNITSVGDNANGYSDSSHIVSVLNGSYTGANFNPQIDSLANNYLGVGINARATEAPASPFNFTVTPVADVAGSLAGKSFNFGNTYSDGGSTFTPWYKVSGAGTAPTCCGGYIEVDIATGDTAATIATATVAAINGSGAPFGGTITVTDLGGSFSIVASHNGAANPFAAQDSGFSAAYISHGAGTGKAVGLQVNMGQATGFSTTPNAIEYHDGAIHGDVTVAIASQTNPSPVQAISTNLAAPASSTVTNADQIGFGTPMFVNVGDNSTITSGAFGLGTVGSGGFMLNQIGTGATIQDVSGGFYAILPIPGGPDGGVITTGHGIQIAALSGAATGSATTFTNFKAFDARAPAGNPATSKSWGLWSDPNFAYNYFGGNVKIGSTGGDTTTYKLDVQGGDTKLDGNIFDNTNVKFANVLGRQLFDNSALLSLDVAARALTDSTNVTSLDWGGRVTYDAVGAPSMDYSSRILYNTSGNRATIYWDQMFLYDGAPQKKSMDWSLRQLYYSDGTTVAYDYQNGAINDSAGTLALQVGPSAREARDTTGHRSIDWSSRDLWISGAPHQSSLNWDAAQLYDLALGNTSLDWSARLLVDTSNINSIKWDDHELEDSAGNPAINYNGTDAAAIYKHLRSSNSGGVTTATINGSAGAGASCTVSGPATDMAGTVTLVTTATGATSGDVCDINFATAYGTAPQCVFSPANAKAAQAGASPSPFFTSSVSAATINFGFADAIGATYVWSYYCIETN